MKHSGGRDMPGGQKKRMPKGRKKTCMRAERGQIKVLHVLKSDRFSGAEHVAMTICRHCGGRFLFAYASKEGEIRSWLEKDGTAYYPMKQFGLKELKRVLREFQPDIVHAHDFSASILCAAVKRRYDLISHLHNDPLWIRSWNMRSVCCFLMRKRMDRILLVSDAVRREAVFFRGCQDKILVIGNPLDAKLVKRRAEEEQAEDQLDCIDLLFAGRLTRQKAPERFIRVVSGLHKSGMPVQAVMLGDGELSEKCRMMIQRYGLSDAVRMEGFHSNPYPYIKRAKLLMIPSCWEGFGLVAVEALALGTPVLAAPVGGLREHFAAFPQALCSSEKEFAVKAAELLSDTEKYEQFRLEMMHKVKAGAGNLESYMRRMCSIYEEFKV